MIKLYIASAKHGHEIIDCETVDQAMVCARAEIDRGRWLYANSDSGMQRLTIDDINADRFAGVEALFSQATLQGG